MLSVLAHHLHIHSAHWLVIVRQQIYVGDNHATQLYTVPPGMVAAPAVQGAMMLCVQVRYNACPGAGLAMMD